MAVSFSAREARDHLPVDVQPRVSEELDVIGFFSIMSHPRL